MPPETIFGPNAQYDREHRDPKIAERIFVALRTLKQTLPAIRLGQIIENCLYVKGHKRDLFNIEDDELASMLESYAKDCDSPEAGDPRHGA